MRKPLREKEGWTAAVAIGSRKKMNEQVARSNLSRQEWDTDRHRVNFQEVRCRVVTSRGSGSGTHVRILEVEEVRRWKGKKMVSKLLLPKPGGMCYRHNLAGPEGGPRARWAQRINVMGL
jgi:hypothetical protein